MYLILNLVSKSWMISNMNCKFIWIIESRVCWLNSFQHNQNAKLLQFLAFVKDKGTIFILSLLSNFIRQNSILKYSKIEAFSNFLISCYYVSQRQYLLLNETVKKTNDVPYYFKFEKTTKKKPHYKFWTSKSNRTAKNTFICRNLFKMLIRNNFCLYTWMFTPCCTGGFAEFVCLFWIFYH